MEILIQNKPPIDFGLGVHDNFRVWKLSLIFIDILVNIYPDRKSMLFGIGIPLVSAIVFSLNTERPSVKRIDDGNNCAVCGELFIPEKPRHNVCDWCSSNAHE